jgi:DNA-binding winged helix-turn-helix (wHTH) protein
VQTKTLEFHVQTIREKLAPHGLRERLVTVPKRGFMWE